jgi:hypothetical protein
MFKRAARKAMFLASGGLIGKILLRKFCTFFFAEWSTPIQLRCSSITLSYSSNIVIHDHYTNISTLPSFFQTGQKGFLVELYLSSFKNKVIIALLSLPKEYLRLYAPMVKDLRLQLNPQALRAIYDGKSNLKGTFFYTVGI